MRLRFIFLSVFGIGLMYGCGAVRYCNNQWIEPFRVKLRLEHHFKIGAQVAAVADDVTHSYELQYSCPAQNFLKNNPKMTRRPLGDGRFDLNLTELFGDIVSSSARVEIDVHKNTLTVRGTGKDVEVVDTLFERFHRDYLRKL